MVDACKTQGVPEPEYEAAGGFVRIVFRRSVAKNMEIVDEFNLDGKELARS